MTTFYRALALGVSAAAMTHATPSFARQPDDAAADDPERIVVTARRREETAAEIPISITTVGEVEFERAGLNRIEDIGNLVPNLTLSERADGTPNVTLRGVGAFGNVRGVGFYVDGVQIFDDTAARFGDLSRIEVLKGPQGVLYGGSNIGGSVIFVSQRPTTDALEARVEGTMGTLNTREVEGWVNVPLNDNWAARAFAYTASTDGFLRNPGGPRRNGAFSQADEDIGRSEQTGARLAIAGDITDRLSMLAVVRYTDIRGPRNTGPVEPFENADGDFDFPDVANLSISPQHQIETYTGSVEFEYDLPFAVVNSLTSYTDSETFGVSDVDLSPEFILQIPSPEAAETITQELRVTSTTPGPFEWIGGFYYLDRNFSRNFELEVFPGFFADEPITDAGVEQTVLATLPFDNREEDLDRAAVFGDATYRFGPVEVEAGARVERWSIETTNTVNNITDDQNDLEVLPRASASLFLNDDRSLLFASYARGFEPGGFNLTNFEGGINLFGFDSEKANSYEIGYKGAHADGRLSLELIGFLVESLDRQFEDIGRDPVSGTVVEGITNIGDSTQIGFEGVATFQVLDTLRLGLSGSWIDAEWDDGTILAGVSDAQGGLGADIGGFTVPFVNKYNLTFTGDYENQFENGIGYFGRVQVSTLGEQQTSLLNQTTNPSYTLVNFAAGIEAEDRRWELTLNLDNAFDTDHYTDIRPFSDFDPLTPETQKLLGNRGEARTFLANFAVRY